MLFSSSVLFLTAGLALAQTPTEKASQALTALQNWYNTTSGLWNGGVWWQGANCMTTIADFAALDSDILTTATSVFTATYKNAPSSHNHVGGTTDAKPWLDGSNDDDGWWALAWIAAYDLTQNQDYLDLAANIFDHMTLGGPTRCENGGIYWDDTRTYVNAISNELFLSVASHLANRITSNQTYYVDQAQAQWTWFKQSGMINAQNTINDGLTDDCKNNNDKVWTYNLGVILGGLVELNKVAPDTSYLEAAGQIAAAAIAGFTDANMVLHESCEPDNCSSDQTQFKGVFIRNLQMLHSVAPQDQYLNVITASANSIWSNDRNSDNQLGVNWAGPFKAPADASTQSSALDCLVAAVALG